MLQINENNIFKYDMIGQFISQGGWIHPRRIIQNYELILVIEGEVFIEEDGVQYSLSPNQMLILEPGKSHGGFKASSTKISFYWLHFITDLELPLKIYKGSEYYETKQLLKRLLHIANTHGYSPFAADAAALMVFEELRRLGSEKAVNGISLINNINEYIRVNIKENITVKSIAEYFGYNPDYIGKLFKMYNYSGLKDYIAHQKIKGIKDLLLTTNLTVKQIAHEFGYKDENAFLKFFVYHEKITPTDFRNNYCNTHINKR